MTKTLDDLKRRIPAQTDKHHYEDRGWNDCIDHLHSQGRILPDGYVAVPLEPTKEMFEAYAGVYGGDFTHRYKAMIAAARKGGV